MRSTNVLLIPLGMVFASTAWAQVEPAGSQSASPLRVTVELLQSRIDRFDLRVVVKNQTPAAIVFPEWQLPWRNRISLTTVAIAAGAIPEKLREVFEIDDPNPIPTVTIDSGEELTGGVSLNRRYPDLIRVLRNTDVIVFWLHQLRRLRETEVRYSGGYVVIPQSPK